MFATPFCYEFSALSHELLLLQFRVASRSATILKALTLTYIVRAMPIAGRDMVFFRNLQPEQPVQVFV